MPLQVNSSLPFDTTTMLMLSVAGIFVKLFLSGGSSKDGSTGPASATIWGYGLTSISFVGSPRNCHKLSIKRRNESACFEGD